MRHLIAFVLIGLAIGLAVSFWRKSQAMAITVVLALVGSIVAGEVVERGLGYAHGKYVSLLAAVIVAAVLGLLARRRGT